MDVVLAREMGMCFGVEDAIALAHTLARQGPLTILGDLVHNEQVLALLGRSGVASVTDPGVVRTARVLITAHGVSDRLKRDLVARGLAVSDATCPLVARAHNALTSLVREGRHPVVIGKAGHVEVRGLVGDHPDHTVLETEADVDRLTGRDRIGIVAQTTQPIGWVLSLVGLIRRRFPRADVRFADTVCQPTKARQEALRDLVRRVRVVVVVGGRYSNNTHRLADQIRALGALAHTVQTASDLEPSWFVGVERVGLTAGTSTPREEIERVRRWLEALEPEPRTARAGVLAPQPV